MSRNKNYLCRRLTILDKKRLYIGGGFDILHHDHMKFINSGIELFEKRYGILKERKGLQGSGLTNGHLKYIIGRSLERL
ncbi:MAG TPA: hypothetical protein DEG71_08940 [Clostridiales bacterium]|nr:hypothetical protein [Clostridiales bacterium]